MEPALATQLVRCGASLGIWAGWSAAQREVAVAAKGWADERLRRMMRRWADACSWRRQVQLVQAWCGRFRGFHVLSLRVKAVAARQREAASAAQHARQIMLCQGMRAWEVAVRTRQSVARAGLGGPDSDARARRACRKALVRWLGWQRSRAEAQVLSAAAVAVALLVALARWARAAAARAQALFALKQSRCSALARALAAWAAALAAARSQRELCGRRRGLDEVQLGLRHRVAPRWAAWQLWRRQSLLQGPRVARARYEVQARHALRVWVARAAAGRRAAVVLFWWRGVEAG